LADRNSTKVLTHDLKAFDAPFFGFTQQEATSLDPQQRLLLECTFEALESAGVPKHNVVGKDVGVFIGGSFSEYEADLFRDPETIPMHQATGMKTNSLSLRNRFSMDADYMKVVLWQCNQIESRISSTSVDRVSRSIPPAHPAWLRSTLHVRAFGVASQAWLLWPVFT
jgi:hypothetical protein